MLLRSALESVRDQSGSLCFPASFKFFKDKYIPRASSFYDICIFALLYTLFLLSQLIATVVENQKLTADQLKNSWFFFWAIIKITLSFAWLQGYQKKSIRCIHSLNTPLPPSQAHTSRAETRRNTKKLHRSIYFKNRSYSSAPHWLAWQLPVLVLCRGLWSVACSSQTGW